MKFLMFNLIIVFIFSNAVHAETSPKNMILGKTWTLVKETCSDGGHVLNRIDSKSTETINFSTNKVNGSISVPLLDDNKKNCTVTYSGEVEIKNDFVIKGISSSRLCENNYVKYDIPHGFETYTYKISLNGLLLTRKLESDESFKCPVGRSIDYLYH